MKLDKSVTPVACAPRRVPLALLKPLKKKLNELENAGIVKKVEQSTEWVSHLVIVRKPSGKLRLCLDPFQLNKAIVRPKY